MRNIFYTLILFCIPLLSVGQQTISNTITHGGLQREYILYVPDSYSPGTSAPLVLNFHGYTSNALEQMLYGDFRSIADTAGFLVVHPLGTIDLLGSTHWNVGWGNSTVDDIGFTIALIDSLSAEYNINQERIYSTGMSNGGFMSYQLACVLSDRIAAIASVTGSMSINLPTSCDPDHPMPVMEIHGTADATVPYEGNILSVPIVSVLNYWEEFNDCTTPPTITAIDNINPNDGSTVEHQLFPNGNDGAVVEHFKVIGGGHTWPGAAYILPLTNLDINASKEIWRFFSRYDINGLINPTSTNDQSRNNPVLVYPNPAVSFITIDLSSEDRTSFYLSTLFGQKVFSGTTLTAKHELDISSLINGMYILTVGQQSYKIVKIE